MSKQIPFKPAIIAGAVTLISSAIAAQAAPIDVSLNSAGELLLEYTFDEQKSGGMWLSAYENGQWSFTTITGATETGLAGGQWRYLYQSDLQCDSGDEFSLRVQGNYSQVDWLPGPTADDFYEVSCATLGSSGASSSSSSAASSESSSSSSSSISPPAHAPVVNASASDAQVQLSWSSVSGATAYRVEYGYATGALQDSQSTDQTALTVTGLDNGFDYDFVVVAVNSRGENASARITATPEAPAAEPESPAVGGYAFGLQSDGTLYHIDGGQTGAWAYLCLNSDCRQAVLNGNRYQYTFSNVTPGQSYDLQFKVQDDASSQCIADASGIAPGNGVTSSPCGSGNASGNDTGGGDNSGGDDNSGGGDSSGGGDNGSGADNGFGGAGGVRVENGVVIANVAERYRVRHELSGNDFNNFNIEYWRARYGALELRDYTRPEAASQRQAACGTSDPCVVVRLDSAVPLAMSDASGNGKDCNQQSPNFRYHKFYGDETNFYYGYVMDLIMPDGSILAACNATQAQRAAATSWQAVMRPDQNIPRPFAQGAQVEFEVTINFDRAQVTGDNVNYYGQTFKYVLGEGFVVNNQDPAIGPVAVNDAFAKLGGDTTVPHLSETGGNQRRFSFMQHAYNMNPSNIQNWLQGRRLFHTNFVNGNHIEQFMPGPQAIGGNLPFPEMAGKASDPVQSSCTECHTNNSVGQMQTGADVVPPKMIGLGLLEAISDSQIEAWAQENGGTVSRITLDGVEQIGRFGWRAEAVSVEHQVAKALHDDIGVGTHVAEFGPSELSADHLHDLVTYSSLLAVPVPRANLAGSQGLAEFESLGCAACHQPTVTTGSDTAFPELANQTIHPFTDLLLHDLGEGEFRTAPLWGLGLSGYIANGSASSLNLMHDGVASSIDEAVQRHNGDGADAKTAYNNASSSARQAIDRFLMNL
ncbi:di-heme oxidoredictase family protein [Gilvimarinus japonicus]|uniref:Di-heme oxidoredictase family protein n=1 Tax=Gilvimarinus japonicus TaxID=1796469 RepID=A0ABV7HWG0_9GAMM